MAKMTPEQAQMQSDEFAAGYAEDQPKTPEQTDDEAFGLGPVATEAPAATEAATDMPVDPAAEMAAEVVEPAADVQSEPVMATEPPAEPTEPAAPALSPEEQRMKSWEGRLKAREAELKAREEAMKAGPSEPGETMAEEVAEPAATEKIEDVVEQVQSGDLTVEQAMKVLASDFGEDFTKMLDVMITSKASEIAGRTADEKVSGMNGKFDSLVNELVEDKKAEHFGSIEEAHPDFLDIAQSEAFRNWVDAMPATDKEAATNTITGGRARDIIKLLSGYKKSIEAPAADTATDTPDEAAMDAAEGVRGKTALKLPEKPKQSSGYEEAWDEF